jgi:hypothetical protein
MPFGSGSVEPKLRIAAPAPASDSFIRYLENFLTKVKGLKLPIFT